MELPPIWKRFFCVIGLQSDHQLHLQGSRHLSISYYTTLITISAFPTTDHSNCVYVDVSKCYLACTDRARDVPKHISVQGRLIYGYIYVYGVLLIVFTILHVGWGRDRCISL